MLKFPLFFVKCVLAGAALISDVRADGTACAMTSESFQARQRYVRVQKQLVSKHITETEKAFKALEGSLKAAKRSKIIGHIVDGLVTVASFIVPQIGIVKNWATEVGLPFVEKILKSKPAKNPESNANPGLIVLIEGKKIYARDPDEALVWIETRLEELEKLAQKPGRELVDHKISFLRDACDKKDSDCAADSVELEELFASLAKWYQKASALALKADDRKKLTSVQLPFVKTTMRILSLKRRYYEQLKTELTERSSGVCA